MDDSIIASRKVQALKVLQYMNEGDTNTDACKKVNISPITYRKYLAESKEAGVLFQEMLSQSSREQLGIILGTRIALLEKLANDAMSPTVEIKDRLAIFNLFEKHLRQVMDEERIGAGDNAAAESVLAGPIFTEGISRFSVTKTTVVTVEKNNTEIPIDIIDGEISNSP